MNREIDKSDIHTHAQTHSLAHALAHPHSRSRKRSHAQVSEFKEAFTLFDKDGSGAISIDELGQVMKSLGQNPSKTELMEMIQEVDDDGSGQRHTHANCNFTFVHPRMLARSRARLTPLTPLTPLHSAPSNPPGEIDFGEFLTMMANALSKEVDTAEEMMKCFRVFDSEGTGCIPREDLHQIIATMAEKMTEDEIKEFIDDADKDGDGEIDYEEFIAMMMKD